MERKLSEEEKQVQSFYAYIESVLRKGVFVDIEDAWLDCTFYGSVGQIGKARIEVALQNYAHAFVENNDRQEITKLFHELEKYPNIGAIIKHYINAYLARIGERVQDNK